MVFQKSIKLYFCNKSYFMKKLYSILIISTFIFKGAIAQLPGNSLQLNADGNYVSISDVSSISLSNNMTWEFWIYYKCENGIGGVFPFSKGWCGTNWSYYIVVENKKLGFWKMNPTGAGTCPSAPHVRYDSDDEVIPYNTWTHVAIVQTGSTVQFYINGESVTNSIVSGSAFTGIKASARPLYIGAYQNLAGSYISTPKGNIDDIRIWHTARTQNQIASNRNQELVGNEPGLVAYYKLNESGNGALINCTNSAVGSSIPNGNTVGTAANLKFVNNISIENNLPICNPLIWYKADSAIFIDNGVTPATNGQSIQQWNDISGNGYHMRQLNLWEQPTLSSTALNGKPALLFDGNDMLSTFLHVNWNGTLDNDIFIVCKSTSPDNMLFESSPSTVSYNGSFYVIDNYTAGGYGVSGALKGTNGAFRTFKNSDGFIPCTKIYQVTHDMNLPGSDAIKIKYNNVPLADNGGYNAGTPTGGLTNHPLFAGRRSDNTYGLIGHIAEMIAFPSKLTTQKAQEVYQYLQQKYFTGTGIVQFNAVPTSATYSDAIVNDETWKHTFNTANSNQIIASIKDNCLDLGTRTDTLYIEPTATMIGNKYVMRRHYTIKTAMNPAGTKRVRLYYTNADFNDLQALIPSLTSHSQLVVTKYNGLNEDGNFDLSGGTVTLIPSAQIITGTAFGQYYLEFEVNGFSEFWIHTGNLPLPVTMKNFSVTKCNNKACLQWLVADEKNLSKYEIERSIDAIRFEKIDEVQAINSSEYNFVDNNPYMGKNYYRLKMLDIDGKYSYTEIKEVKFENGKWNISILPTYSENGIYTFNSNKEVKRVYVYDINGHLLLSDSNTKGNIDISNYASGIYLIKIYTEHESAVIKVAK